MTEDLKPYENYPHLTGKDIRKLIKIKDALKKDKEFIDFSRKKGIDEPELKEIVIRNTYKLRKLLDNEINIHISGVPKDKWEKFGEKFKNKSAEIVDFIKKSVE